MAEPNPTKKSDDQSQPGSGVTMTPGQVKFMYWFTGIIPILKALTPPATYYGDIRKPLYNHLPPALRAKTLYQSVISDIGRQTMTCTFQLVSYFIGGDLIKMALKQLPSSKKPATNPDEKNKQEARNQMLLQVSSLTIQFVATVLSRPFGASQIIRMFHQEEKPTPATGGKWTRRANDWINKYMRDPKTKNLLPLKMALMATGGIAVYLGALVGVLYGISTVLDKLVPGIDSKKSSKTKTSEPVMKAPPAPAATPIPLHTPIDKTTQPAQTQFPAQQSANAKPVSANNPTTSSQQQNQPSWTPPPRPLFAALR